MLPSYLKEAKALHDILVRNGRSFKVDEGSLVVIKGDQGDIPPETMELIKQHKKEILAVIQYEAIQRWLRVMDQMDKDAWKKAVPIGMHEDFAAAVQAMRACCADPWADVETL